MIYSPIEVPQRARSAIALTTLGCSAAFTFGFTTANRRAISRASRTMPVVFDEEFLAAEQHDVSTNHFTSKEITVK